MEKNKYILNFQKALIEVQNQTFLIENEIKEIENMIYRKQPTALGVMSDNLTRFIANSVFQFEYYPTNLFNSIFHKYLINNEFDVNSLPDNRFKERDIEIAKDAIEFAEYYKWLKELTPSIIESKPTKKSDLNLSQKVLALHYLGLDLTNFDKTKSSKVLSKILGQSESNTKSHLTNLYSAKNETKIKNLKNLKLLLEVFENEQFNKIQNKIKKDIENLG